MIEVFAERRHYGGRIDLVFLSRERGATGCAAPLQFKAIEDGETPDEPTVRLNNEQAQALMDELWRCGLRPTDGSGSAGSLAATERHLKDMRTIAMGMLAKEGVAVS